jgi:polysaccharide export outer membrane protein
MLVLLLIFDLLCLGIPGYSQKVSDLTDDQVRQFVQQAKTSGMSETQIEQLAISRGFTSADVKKMRERITDLGKTPAPDQSGSMPVSREQGDKRNLSTTQIVRAETAGNTLPVFGASLFTTTNLTFEPNLRIPTPKNWAGRRIDHRRIRERTAKLPDQSQSRRCH